MAVVEHPWPDGAFGAVMQVVWQRIVSGKPTQDVAVTKLAFISSSGSMDNYNPAIPNQDMTIAEEEFGTFWGAVKGFAHVSHGLSEFRWYRLTSPTVPVEGPMRVNTQAAPSLGTDSSSLPPQVSFNLTLETSIRKHWGRMCLPLTGASAKAADGRASSAAVDSIAEAGQTLLQQIRSTSTFLPVIYSRPSGDTNEISGIRVDDTYDIIRRRRYEGVPYRKLLPVI